MTAAHPAAHPARGPRVAAIALWILAGMLVLGVLVTTATVVDAVRALADAFLAPPPLASTAWVQGILAAAARERAFGIAVPALASAAGLAVVLALVARAIRSGRRFTSGRWLALPAVGGAALLAGAIATLGASTSIEGFYANGITGTLFSPQARGGLGVAAALGGSGMLVLAAVVGWLAVRSRRVLLAATVIAVALGVAVVPAIVTALAPLDAVLRAPSYPAQTLAADPHASALASIAATGCGAFALAAAAASVVRTRDRTSGRR